MYQISYEIIKEVYRMNKKIILVILIIVGVVAVSGCISSEETSNNDISTIDNVSDSSLNDTEISNTTEPESISQDSSNSSSYSSDTSKGGNVIITKTGSKYHNYVHGNMKYYEYVSLSYAEKYYEPCNVCT